MRVFATLDDRKTERELASLLPGIEFVSTPDAADVALVVARDPANGVGVPNAHEYLALSTHIPTVAVVNLDSPGADAFVRLAGEMGVRPETLVAYRGAFPVKNVAWTVGNLSGIQLCEESFAGSERREKGVRRVPFWEKLFRFRQRQPQEERPGDLPVPGVPGPGGPGAGTAPEGRPPSADPGVALGCKPPTLATRTVAQASGLHFAAGGVLVLAHPEVAARLARFGVRCVADPRDAVVCVCSPEEARLVPPGMPLVVYLGDAGPGEWLSWAEKGVPVATTPEALAREVRRLLGPEKDTPVSGPVPGLAGKTATPTARGAGGGRRGVVAAFYSGAQGQQGKTTLALNLAALLAEGGLKVRLADLDTDKGGLSTLCGFSESSLPPVDLTSALEGGEFTVPGPAGTELVPAPLDRPGWFPEPEDAARLVGALASGCDCLVLDFGARIASPAVLAVLGECNVVFFVSTPLRSALSAVARFRAKCLAEVGAGKIVTLVNRAGIRGGVSVRDAALLLGVGDEVLAVPEEPAVVEADGRAALTGIYHPPVLEPGKKKSSFRKALEGVASRVPQPGRAVGEEVSAC
ncbi:hypothetical protein [Ammonifex thiophilus]|uniref:CobQ/CobB/MinD/ParA nucleotide binding domain-containing protein n=1 Tax=Ammonifex thiophilus TaxID=444093 RepID=A0A3D8P1Y8_9THEO|nr:hypothetical protein [Ammonifex thiophilus]RDV80493.1 hypothetical protein DXX99_10770 [Ammonifex thiophilus]